MLDMKCICWFFNMATTEKRSFVATFVCLFAHLTLAVLHIFPPIDAILEHGFALALFQMLEALVNLSTLWAQIKQSLFSLNSEPIMSNSTSMLQTNSFLLDGKNREIKELKSQLNQLKESNKMMNQNIMHLQQQIHLLTQKLEDEEKRANILAKSYGNAQKKLARAEVRHRHIQRTVQELEAENFELKWPMPASFDVFADFSLLTKASISRSQSESKPTTNSFANIAVNPPTATNANYNEKPQSPMPASFDVFADLSFLTKASISRSQSESKPTTNSFANIAAKPPTATNANYNEQLRMIMPQPAVMLKNNSPISQSEIQQKRTDKGDELKTSDGDEEEKGAKNYLHKTQICVFWKAYVSGKSRTKCRNGPDCNFAHGEKELKKLDPFYFKTELCQFWNLDEPCPYGDGCNFAHGPDELRQMGVKGPKSAVKAPSFYNNRQRLRKTRTKTQTIQPLTSYGKPVEQKVTVITGH